MDIQIFVVPYDSGRLRWRCGAGPEYLPAKPDTCASSAVKSPMQPSSIRPPLSITKTLPGWLCCIASRNTSTLPKCRTGRASPAIRVPGTTGLIPGGATRNAIFRRSAASATSGVESSPKAAERDCCFTRPKNHGIEKSKIRNQLPSLKTTAWRKLYYCGRRLKLPSP